MDDIERGLTDAAATDGTVDVHDGAPSADSEMAESSPSSGQRRSRRLSDKILLTFHAACDVREFYVARQLLSTLEWLIRKTHFRSPVDRRRNSDALVAAHERLWSLRNSSNA